MSPCVPPIARLETKHRHCRSAAARLSRRRAHGLPRQRAARYSAPGTPVVEATLQGGCSMFFAALHVGRMFYRGLVGAAALAVAAMTGGGAVADPMPPGWQAEHVKPIGFSALVQATTAPSRWRSNHPKTGIVGISIWGSPSTRARTSSTSPTPSDPQIREVHPLPTGGKGWITSQVTVDANLMSHFPSTASRRARMRGRRCYLWDISDPVNPKQIFAMERRRHRRASQFLSRRQIRLSPRPAIPGVSRGNIPGHPRCQRPPLHPKRNRQVVSSRARAGEPPSRGPAQGFHGPANISPDGKMASAAVSRQM